jgi:Ser/Thr protein kinase RdoA (MazF antagonist)
MKNINSPSQYYRDRTLTSRSLVNNEYLVRVILKKYDLGIITLCRLIKFGGSNDIFSISSSKGQFILKIFFKRECWNYTEAHYLFELELQEFLNFNEVSTSRPIKNKSGELLDTIDLPEGVRFFSIYEYSYGKKWDHVMIDDKRIKNLGSTIAKLHLLAQKFQNKNNIDRKLDINLLLDKSWLSISTCVTLPSQFIKSELNKIYLNLKSEYETFPIQDLILIHGDVHAGNHLYEPGIKKITLLDFELAGYGFLNYEFAVLKWDLIQNSHKKNFINKVMDEFLNAYITQNIVDIDYNLINFFVKARYFFMLGSSFLFYPDKPQLNNEYILNKVITSIKKLEKGK